MIVRLLFILFSPSSLHLHYSLHEYEGTNIGFGVMFRTYLRLLRHQDCTMCGLMLYYMDRNVRR